MESTLYIVPITNFVIESVFKIGDIYFSPPYTKMEFNELSFTDTITQSEFEKIQGYINTFNKSKQIPITNDTIAITNFGDFDYENFQQASALVDRVCEKIDRALDYFRLTNCQIGNFDTLPGLPGIVPDGFKIIYKWDKKSNTFVTVSGELTIMFQKGIGLMPSTEPNLENSQDIDWVCLFSDRKDEVFLNCRAALTRVNEAMYMHNLNAAFIYLMTTIEMLADKDKTLTFKKIRPKILPFLANDKNNYNELSEYIRNLSKLKRTEIVHNGKNIFELYTDKNQVLTELFKVTGLIIRYVEAVVALEVYTFEDLENKRNELKNQLGV